MNRKIQNLKGNQFLQAMVLMVTDILFVFASAWLAMLIEHGRLGMAEAVKGSYICICIITCIILLAMFVIFRLYRSMMRYIGVMEIIKVAFSSLMATSIHCALLYMFPGTHNIASPGYILIFFFILFALTGCSRCSVRVFHALQSLPGFSKKDIKRVMIVGAGDAGMSLKKEIDSSDKLSLCVKCFVDDSIDKRGAYIMGTRVCGGRNDIPDLVKKFAIQEIYIAMPSAPEEDIHEIISICSKTGCRLKRLPGMYQFISGEISTRLLRDISTEDLLARKPVKVDLDSIMSYVSDKVIMVTGGGGSIGSELCRQIASHNPHKLIIVDIYENNAYDIQQELIKKYPLLNLETIIASVRDEKRMDRIFDTYRPQIIYHAAAHKHVPLMEESPNEAIKNNVFGTYRMARLADKYEVKKFVLISTDKAVNPTNVMGATKRMCEMIVQGYARKSKTEFMAVRFGNVLGSNGSVIPLFKKQIASGGPVCVTHPEIIRYFMTIPEAVALVLEAGAYAKGGEIFVLDMGKPVKILDLAENLIRLSGFTPYKDIDIKFTGLRPGEKLYEELLMDEEGLQDTDNNLIHIGKPINFDEDAFFEALDKLKKVMETEPKNAREIISKLVPTYKGNPDIANI